MRIAEWFDPDQALLDSRCPLPLDAPFTAAMAKQWGVTEHQLRRLVAEGYVRRVLQGVYAAVQATDDVDFRATALGFVVPKTAVVTDRTAAWLHGVAILPRSAPYRPPPISVFQTSGTRVRRPQVDGGLRTLRPDDITVVNGIQVTTPLRTAIDLGRLLWRFDALLPPPEPQLWVQDDFGVDVYRLDLTLPELRYAAEYDGEEYHGEDQEEHDGERRMWLSEKRGWLIDVFGKDDVYGQNPSAPDRLRAGVMKARLALGGWRPPWAPRGK